MDDFDIYSCVDAAAVFSVVVRLTVTDAASFGRYPSAAVVGTAWLVVLAAVVVALEVDDAVEAVDEVVDVAEAVVAETAVVLVVTVALLPDVVAAD